ncbi:hypothetical protein DASC09_019240 [Saccharomycopsis crataegensis]|uniref:Uncharacterized protein n=1 Tax=Saccharomycopsis crataegensis TaxID=43959 RepID=A0AAV5QIM9_9ASCO|nr:hypothetical protein DASC09_019240 [Saccharomycopsis crataegensis]
MDISHIINASGIENPQAALYIDYSDGLCLTYYGNYFSTQDPNEQAYHLYTIVKGNSAIIDKDGFGLIKYHEFDVYLFYDPKLNKLLAVYK